MNNKKTPGTHDPLVLNLQAIEMRILKIEKCLLKAFPDIFENSSQGIQLKD